MSAPGRADLLRAKNVVRVVEERGVVHQDDLPAVLGCGWAEARAAVGIAWHWRRVDRCGDYLVPAPSQNAGRRAA